MFLVLYKLWCFTFPLNHFGKLIWEICFSGCCYVWIENLGIRNYLAILSLRGLSKRFIGTLLVDALWFYAEDIVVNHAVRWSAKCHRREVFSRASRVSVVGMGCTGSELLLLRLPTCLFEWKCHAFALYPTQMNSDSSWRCVLLRRRDLWAKAWQPAPSSPDFSLYCTLEYESLAFSQHFLDQYLERKISIETRRDLSVQNLRVRLDWGPFQPSEPWFSLGAWESCRIV